MDYYKTDEFLEHYGILGMKWGVRKPETLDRYNRMRRAGQKPPKGGSKKARKKASAEVVNMTDDELRDRVNRIRMEQQYVDLKAGQLKRGKNAVAKALDSTAKEYVNKAVQIGATALATKWVGAMRAAQKAAKAGEAAAPLLIEMKHSDIDDFLTHHGIMGMKWGVRKPETLARYARSKKPNSKAKKIDKAPSKRAVKKQEAAKLKKDREWVRQADNMRKADAVMNSEKTKAELDKRILELSARGGQVSFRDAATLYENIVNETLQKQKDAQSPSGERYIGIQTSVDGKGNMSVSYGSFPHALNKIKK